jgi:anti-sigma regulatory factor (Ser/Thr protein kinase)
MEIEVRCRVDASMLRLLREVICSVSHHLGFSEQECGEIEMCVDEACANAIEHAYSAIEAPANNEENRINIEVYFDGEALTVRVIDSGRGLKKTVEQPLHTLDKYLDAGHERYRGLGFYLMNKFMDRVDVTTVPGEGTTVEMTKIRK